MPSFGCYGGVWPIRFGGGTPALKTRHEGILAQLGTAYSKTDSPGLVWLRAMAMARAFQDVWETNRRMALQWDPERVTDFLGRWEKICSLPVSPNDSLSVRRARLAIARARAGYADASTIYTTCLAYLGASVFVSVVTTSSASADVYTPSGWPMGNHPTVLGDTDWSSGVSHIAIMTQQPSAMDDGTYYTTRASVIPALDAILPSWVTFDVLRDGAGGAIFRLDDSHNLDNERFG